MQIAHIVPVSCCDITSQQPISLFLTHLVEKYPGYAKFAREYKGFKILDNSLIELGSSVSLERILEAADAIQADEVILPDVFRQGPETLQVVEDSLNKLGDLSKYPYEFMAVCQGRDLQEFADCFDALDKMVGISTIGIPKVCAKMSPRGRPAFEDLWHDYTDKNIHLLGLWYGWEELSRYIYPADIRSVDTCHLAWQMLRQVPVHTVRPDGHTISLDLYCNITQEDFDKKVKEVEQCIHSLNPSFQITPKTEE